MAYFSRRRYTAYRRRGRLRWVVVVALVGAALVADNRQHSAATASVSVIITATATASEPGPALSADIVQTMRTAGLGSTPATAYVVAPGAHQPDAIPLTPYLPNGQADYGPTRGAVLADNISAVQQAVEDEAAQGGFDVLATITAAIKAAPAARPR